MLLQGVARAKAVKVAEDAAYSDIVAIARTLAPKDSSGDPTSFTQYAELAIKTIVDVAQSAQFAKRNGTSAPTRRRLLVSSILQYESVRRFLQTGGAATQLEQDLGRLGVLMSQALTTANVSRGDGGGLHMPIMLGPGRRPG